MKKRYNFQKKRTRRSFGKFSRRARSGLKGVGGKAIPYIQAGAYGAVRSPIAAKIQPLTERIPFGGTLKDNLGMFLLSWGVSKFGGRIPGAGQILVGVARQGMVVEAAQIGQELAQGGFTATNQGNGNMPIFG